MLPVNETMMADNVNRGMDRDVDGSSDCSLLTTISHLMSSCDYQLKLNNSIRASLDVQVSERVVNAIFTSRLDYCNSLLAGRTV